MNVCSGCSRHVRERVCPFCGARASSTPAMRVVRAVVVATACSAAIASTTACYGGAPIPVTPQGGGDASTTTAP